MTRAVLMVTIVGMLAGRARADEPADTTPADATEKATKLYAEGKRHFDIGEYPQAIASWKESYLLSSAPLLLFNIGQAYRLSNNCAQANRFYLNYRRVEAKPKNKAELDKAMAKCAGVEPATGDPEPDVKPVDPVVVPKPPEPPDVKPVPPTVPDLTAHVDPNPLIVPAPPPPSGGVLRTAGIITGTVGATLLVTGIVLAIKANSDANSLSKLPVGTTYAGMGSDLDSSGRLAASRAKLALGFGGAFLLGGVGMWYLGHRRGQAQIEVSVGPGHSEVSYSCAF